jgi:geranylgeranyl diphosphate synthase, type I
VNDNLIAELLGDIEQHMQSVVDRADQDAAGLFGPSDLALYDVIRYHLGWVDENFQQAQSDAGKRIRPIFCLLSASAAGGDPRLALPVAAAIELLHNFTLMHDDIQDRSDLRRGRPTVWRQWGEAQAINAGDATFALSQIALAGAVEAGLDGCTVTELLTEFNRMTLRIVEGQVLDLGFESRSDVQPDEYLQMIGGKTAAIVAFASWAGARIAGRDRDDAARWGELGRLLGLGFQIRDDFLGIWGNSADTGKQAGDDIRSRKQSIPIILLMNELSEEERNELLSIYHRSMVDQDDVARVTAMLDRHNIADQVQGMAADYHQRGLALLQELGEPGPARDALVSLAEQLVDRSR